MSDSEEEQEEKDEKRSFNIKVRTYTHNDCTEIFHQIKEPNEGSDFRSLKEIIRIK